MIPIIALNKMTTMPASLRGLYLLPAIILLLNCGVPQANELAQELPGQAQVFTGKVVAVKDGDTIEVMRDGRAVRIRLEHIDCPESAQPFGKAAKQFTSDLCYGRMALVEAQPAPDRYGRLIATIHVDGRCLNMELVRAGLAWHFKRYSKDLEYARLEEQARLEGQGMWADGDAVAPWEWRKVRRPRG